MNNQNQNDTDYDKASSIMIEGNYDEAKILYIKAADQGHLPSQVMVANLYKEDENMGMAVKYYKMAGDQNNIESQFELGQYYDYRDLETAIIWHTKAANQDHPPSQSWLGMLYHYGRVKQDTPRAIEWWKKAAKQDYAFAKMHLKELSRFRDIS